ncbi:unnamed protein product [Brassica oleracea var. botrytis]|uniref:B box-type domain-containing protein n=2 Tax=Brassica oleracea TaxID=3712 RepID=A0A0D3D5N5_BRAOL|nr:PREDICTED: uncharacterized protein LOC106304939 [Brassica oleracea var. oleracea]VDD36409.1 unnamed protein product [Brassica oleracea]
MVREGQDEEEEEEEEMMMMVAATTKPAWLKGLIGETFFSSCGIHESRRKSEKNVFCLLCCLSVCPHCLPSHRSHPLLQVRRYVYHDVVRLSDLEKLIDCSYVQPYTINGAKVIFINQRPQSRAKVSSNVCFTCDRILQEPFHFCSLSCKVDYLVYQGDDLSSILYRIDESDFTFASLRMDGHDQFGEISTMEDDADDIIVISDQSEQGNNSNKKEKKKKKKKESNYFPGMVLSLGSRRKGAPHRAPFS